MEGKIIGCWILSNVMNWEDGTQRLSAHYFTDLYCNTREEIMQGGKKGRILKYWKGDSSSLNIGLSGAYRFCDSIVKINTYKDPSAQW